MTGTQELQQSSTFAEDVIRGLQANPKRISSKHFYDTRGSELFQKITTLEAYYPTRIELEILRASAPNISTLVGNDPTDIIGLGSGCGEKTTIILDQMVADGRDIVLRTIDISQSAIEALDAIIKTRYEGRVPRAGIVADYEGGLALIDREQSGRKKLILFFGSNIGNMTDDEAAGFLLRVSTSMQPGDRIVIGADLKKDLKIIERAYNDPEGVTRDFNLNLLTRMNRELGADFNLANFVHHPFYDPNKEAMVSWIVSTKEQTINFPAHFGGPVFFRAGEGIWTEMSRKYSLPELTHIAEGARLQVEHTFTDANCWFADVVLQKV